jgi:hypothetical protein
MKKTIIMILSILSTVYQLSFLYLLVKNELVEL